MSFVEMSTQGNILASKCPSGEISGGEMSGHRFTDLISLPFMFFENFQKLRLQHAVSNIDHLMIHGSATLMIVLTRITYCFLMIEWPDTNITF